MHKFFLLLFSHMLFSSTKAQTGSTKIKLDSNIILEVGCHKNDPLKRHISFFLRLSNFSDKTISTPERFVSGELDNGQCNLEYEILFCEKDTVNITRDMVSYINIGRSPENNHIIPAQKNYIFDIEIHNSFFSKKGRYNIRFVLKKDSIGDITDIFSDINTRWYFFELL